MAEELRQVKENQAGLTVEAASATLIVTGVDDCGNMAICTIVDLCSVIEPPEIIEITICHIPPGNPNNARTMVVNESDLPAHLRHGDTLGPCCEDDADCQDGEFCNGDEFCDGGTCVPGADPCAANKVCDEENETCLDRPVGNGSAEASGRGSSEVGSVTSNQILCGAISPAAILMTFVGMLCLRTGRR